MNYRWVKIPGASEYRISVSGRLFRNGKPVTTSQTKHGALQAQIVNDRGVYQTVQVARLVGKAFCPDFRPGHRPKHLNGNQRDCRAKNLEWVSVGEAWKIANHKHNGND